MIPDPAESRLDLPEVYLQDDSIDILCPTLEMRLDYLSVNYSAADNYTQQKQGYNP